MATITPKKEAEIEHLIWTDPERMSGTPCFYSTRVPVKTFSITSKAGRVLRHSLTTSKASPASRPTRYYV
jgi:hypothetical protein